MSEQRAQAPDHRATPVRPAHRFAVTGSTGFIGRHLVSYLRKAGHQVDPISRGSDVTGTVRHVPSYGDAASLAAAFAGCSHVVHLAARAHVLHEEAEDPQAAFEEANAASAAAVAVAARRAGVRRLVLISSIGVLGNRTDGRPFSDDSQPCPQEPYAISKWRGEQAVSAELAAAATDYVILRPPLVYGPGCPGNFRALMNMVRRLPVIPLGALRRPRSLIHVENLCDAIGRAAVHPAASRRTFVVSDGDDLCVADVARILSEACGKSARRVLPAPTALLRGAAAVVGRASTFDKLESELIVDSSGFRLATGWTPPRTTREALASTMRSEAKISRAVVYPH